MLHKASPFIIQPSKPFKEDRTLANDVLVRDSQLTMRTGAETLFELVKPENAHFLREVQEEARKLLPGSSGSLCDA